MTLQYPTWLGELDVAMPANPQVLITGNIRDDVLIPQGEARPPRQTSVINAVIGELQAAGHRNVIVYDPVDGARVHSQDGDAASRLIGASGNAEAVNLESLTGLARAVVSSEQPCVLILDNASRLFPAGDFADAEVHRFLATCEKLMLTAVPRRVEGRHRAPLYNSMVWILDQQNDLPQFLTSSELTRVISVPRPSKEHRLALARRLRESEEIAEQFAALTDGLTLRSMLEINRLAQDRQIPANDIDDAVRLFRHGIPDNPWQSDRLRKDIAKGVETLSARVFGQSAAIRKAVDILIRSCTGLTGAESSGTRNRPQGVLFFAGPTGVGKTELAKSIAELVFGAARTDSFIRFDMSEFRAEHSDARLIGAPPGYTGYGGGGELTNAVRQQPFRLILFDEIEKANERILDKFLQILDDGRLTDGSGNTVFFNETLLVFTSNLGVYEEDQDGNRVPVVSRGAPYTEVEQSIRKHVAEHFKTKIGRPELLNRFGDNIVVFNFIADDIAREMVPKFVANVTRRVREERGLDVTVSDEVMATLTEEALLQLDFGGRGVRNTVESLFTNPLARSIFLRTDATTSVTVKRLRKAEDGWAVELV